MPSPATGVQALTDEQERKLLINQLKVILGKNEQLAQKCNKMLAKEIRGKLGTDETYSIDIGHADELIKRVDSEGRPQSDAEVVVAAIEKDIRLYKTIQDTVKPKMESIAQIDSAYVKEKPSFFSRHKKKIIGTLIVAAIVIASIATFGIPAIIAGITVAATVALPYLSTVAAFSFFVGCCVHGAIKINSVGKGVEPNQVRGGSTTTMAEDLGGPIHNATTPGAGSGLESKAEPVVTSPIIVVPDTLEGDSEIMEVSEEPPIMRTYGSQS